MLRKYVRQLKRPIQEKYIAPIDKIHSLLMESDTEQDLVEKTITVENIFPPAVIGYISPYPTVVRVVTDHHKEWNTDLNCSGWAACSK